MYCIAFLDFCAISVTVHVMYAISMFIHFNLFLTECGPNQFDIKREMYWLA